MLLYIPLFLLLAFFNAICEHPYSNHHDLAIICHRQGLPLPPRMPTNMSIGLQIKETVPLTVFHSPLDQVLIAFVKDITPLKFSCYYVLSMSHTTH